MRKRNDLSEILYEVLINTHRGCVAEVAMEAGMAERTVYDYCQSNRANPPVTIFVAGYLVTKDPRLERLITPAGYKLIPADIACPATSDYERELGDVEMAVSGLRREVRQARDDDGVIDKRELVDIQRRCNEVREQLAEVEALAAMEAKGMRVVKS